MALHLSYSFHWRRVKKAQILEFKLRRLQELLGLRWRPSGVNASIGGMCGG